MLFKKARHKGHKTNVETETSGKKRNIERKKQTENGLASPILFGRTSLFICFFINFFFYTVKIRNIFVFKFHQAPSDRFLPTLSIMIPHKPMIGQSHYD